MPPRKRKPLQAQVDEMRAMLRRLGARVEELEDQRHQELASAIGFEAEVVEEDDEEEIPEMGRQVRRRIGY